MPEEVSSTGGLPLMRRRTPVCHMRRRKPEEVSSTGGLPDSSAKCTSPERMIKFGGRVRSSSSSRRRLAAGKCAHDSSTD